MRSLIKRYKVGFVLLGDALAVYISLAIALFIRYGSEEFSSAWHNHVWPFTLVMGIWVIIFYISDLYSYARWRSNIDNIRIFIGAIIASFGVSVFLFYLFGTLFKLTPKLNLILFTALFFIIDGMFRLGLARFLASRAHATNVVILSKSTLALKLIDHIAKHPQLGYRAQTLTPESKAIESVLLQEGRKIFVVDNAFMKENSHASLLYTVTGKAEIETLLGMYERLLYRVPLEEIDEAWLVDALSKESGAYAFLKRAFDFFFALGFFITLLPLSVLIAILVTISSPGPIIYRQKRVGKDGKIFTLNKFRTMRADAEKNGAQWWSGKGDNRVTKIGAFLRHTHLDEIPQIWNILIGQMSFVGPRPERPEFTEKLVLEIPHYPLRETILPGLSGWAQIKFRYANTALDAREKFEYDLYYVKNKNFLLDLGILAKTIQFIFRNL